MALQFSDLTVWEYVGKVHQSCYYPRDLTLYNPNVFTKIYRGSILVAHPEIKYSPWDWPRVVAVPIDALMSKPHLERILLKWPKRYKVVLPSFRVTELKLIAPDKVTVTLRDKEHVINVGETITKDAFVSSSSREAQGGTYFAAASYWQPVTNTVIGTR